MNANEWILLIGIIAFIGILACDLLWIWFDDDDDLKGEDYGC